MNDDDLGRLFDEVASPLAPRPGRAAGIVAASRRRRAYAAVASVTAIVLIVVGSLAFLGGGGSTRLSPAAPTPSPAVTTPAVTASSASPVPSATAPPGTISIGCSSKAPFVALSHIKQGVYGTAIAAPLRAFLGNPTLDATLGLDLLPHQQWALFSHDTLYRIFVQRTATGIGAVLSFKLYLGSWRPVGQCQIAYPDGVAQSVTQAAVRGRTLDLNWDNGTCYPEAARPLISALVRRVIVTESATHVLVSLITYENPAELAAMASQQASLPSGAIVACGGVGLQDHVKVTLKAPLGERTLLSVSSGGPGPITLDGTVGAPLQ